LLGHRLPPFHLYYLYSFFITDQPGATVELLFILYDDAYLREGAFTDRNYVPRFKRDQLFERYASVAMNPATGTFTANMLREKRFCSWPPWPPFFSTPETHFWTLTFCNKALTRETGMAIVAPPLISPTLSASFDLHYKFVL
jgi:hypothetical protein